MVQDDPAPDLLFEGVSIRWPIPASLRQLCTCSCALAAYESRRIPQLIPRLWLAAQMTKRSGPGGPTHSDIDTRPAVLFPEKMPQMRNFPYLG